MELSPTPAVGGLPKKESLQWIGEREPLHRQYYSGFLGPVHSAAHFHLFVNLRCMQLQGSNLALYAGAGITAGSVPQNEWEETRRKMEIMRSVLSL